MKAPLFIIYYDLGLGGVQRKIVDIVNFLAENQPDLQIYVLLRRKPTGFDLSEGIKNRRAKIIYYLDWLKIRIPLFFPIFVLYQTWKLRPMAILTFSDVPSLSAIWMKLLFLGRQIRVVVSEDRYISREVATYRFAPLRQFLIKLFYRFADMIYSPNQAMAKDLAKACNLPVKRVKIVKNWTNLAERKVDVSYKKYDLIYVGRFVKVKTIRFLLRGVKELKKYKKDVSLCMVGEGGEERDLKSWVRANRLGGNIIFTGAKYEIENYLSQAKIFVYPSRAEGLPLVVLEAMAMGLPVVVFNYPGAKEVIKNGENGFVYKNLKEFGKIVLMLLKNQSLREKIGRRAREYVKLHHSPENIKTYLEALGLSGR